MSPYLPLSDLLIIPITSSKSQSKSLSPLGKSGKLAPRPDAWESANRNNIFNDIGLKRLLFIASSDFHKPKHIYSWENLIHAWKDAEAIKDCIRATNTWPSLFTATSLPISLLLSTLDLQLSTN